MKENNELKWITIWMLALIIGMMSSCAPEHVEVTTCVTGKPDGFLLGLWHGVIAPITFIISLFSDSVEFYSVNNNGGWYNFGFVLGAGILLGSSSSRK